MPEPFYNLSVVLLLISSILLFQNSECFLASCYESKWPDRSAWSELNISVNGQLIRARPWAWPCHDPHYDQQACDRAKRFNTNAFKRAEVVGAMQYPNWEAGIKGYGCPLNTSRSSPCYQGQVSEYAIEVLNVSHVQLGIRFAKLHHIPLVIKSTGHDWLGRSTARGSLSLWLHRLKKISFNSSFVEDGCSSSGSSGVPGVTAESGANWDEIYDFLDARGMIVVGGMGSSVSAAGGYVQGGGHGPLSRTFGLGADNVLEFKVVTADGQIRVANKCQNKDLFWALSGGGAGTYGVVISATFRTYPAFPRGITQTIYVAGSFNSSSQRSLIRKFIDESPAMDEAGLAGYFYIYTNAIVLSFLLPNGTVAEARAALQPLVSFVDQHPLLSTITYNVTSYPAFVTWHDGVLCPTNPGVCTDPTGTPRRLATRFMPKRIIQESPELLTTTFMRILYERSFSPIFGLFVVGGAVSEPRNNSISKVWRESLWHVSLSRSWNDTTSVEEQQRIAAYLTATNALLRDITPGGGCYKNEADYYEPDWQQSFYGEKYSTLKAIKQSVDPTNLFRCWKCVGSEQLVNDA